MKKLLAILMAAVMLLGACAFAESGQVTVKNIVVAADGQVSIDLTGFEVEIEGALEEGMLGLRAACFANGADVGGVVAAILGEQLLVKINGASNSLYGMDLSQFELFHEAMDGLEEGIAYAYVSVDGLSEELLAQFNEVFAGSVTDGGVTQIEGMDFDTVLIEITEEQIDAAYAMAVEQAEEIDSEVYAEEVVALGEEVSLSVSGALYTNEAVQIADITLHVDAKEDGKGALNFYAVYVAGGAENGGDLLSIVFTALEEGQEILAAAADFEFIATDDVSWLQLDAANAVDIEALIESGEFEDTMVAEFTQLGTMIASGAMSVMYANMAEMMAAQAE